MINTISRLQSFSQTLIHRLFRLQVRVFLLTEKYKQRRTTVHVLIDS